MALHTLMLGPAALMPHDPDCGGHPRSGRSPSASPTAPESHPAICGSSVARWTRPAARRKRTCAAFFVVVQPAVDHIRSSVAILEPLQGVVEIRDPVDAGVPLWTVGDEVLMQSTASLRRFSGRRSRTFCMASAAEVAHRCTFWAALAGSALGVGCSLNACSGSARRPLPTSVSRFAGWRSSSPREYRFARPFS